MMFCLIRHEIAPSHLCSNSVLNIFVDHQYDHLDNFIYFGEIPPYHIGKNDYFGEISQFHLGDN